MKKNIKRMTSAFLTAGMMLSCFSGMSFNVIAAENNENIVFENFDSANVNTTFVTGNGSVALDPENAENRAWKIENTTSGKTTLMTNLRPSTFLTDIPEDKTFIIDIKIKMPWEL